MLLTLDDIKKRLEDRRISTVAEATGLTRQTLYNLQRGAEPTYSTLVALTKYFEERP